MSKYYISVRPVVDTIDLAAPVIEESSVIRLDSHLTLDDYMAEARNRSRSFRGDMIVKSDSGRIICAYRLGVYIPANKYNQFERVPRAMV